MPRRRPGRGAPERPRTRAYEFNDSRSRSDRQARETPVDRWEDLRQHIACRESRMDKVRYFCRSEFQSWLVKLPWERWL